MLFDDHASQFDRTRGIPSRAVEEIVKAIASLAPILPESVLLEIGAGTGKIGFHLSKLPIKYIGFDLSNQMLEIFRKRLNSTNTDSLLVETDGNSNWPADDGSVDIIFAARVLHLLEPHHVVKETLRVGKSSGSVIITGRIRRDNQSVKSRMRHRMRELLEIRGINVKDAKSALVSIYGKLEACGGERIRPRFVSRWSRPSSPLQSIDSWRKKRGLGGIDISNDIKTRVLEELHQWTMEEYSDPERTLETVEQYELSGVRLKVRP